MPPSSLEMRHASGVDALAHDVDPPASLYVWHDVARDWHLWSKGERAAAILLAIALAAAPAVLLVAGYVRSTA